MQFVFADHVLDTRRRELHRGSARIALEPQVFDLLTYPLQNRDRVVSRDDLIASVWSGRIVSDSTLAARLNAARKAIGDSGREQRLIRTIQRRGFRFVGTVHTQPTDGKAADAAGARPGDAQRLLGNGSGAAFTLLPHAFARGESRHFPANAQDGVRPALPPCDR